MRMKNKNWEWKRERESPHTTFEMMNLTLLYATHDVRCI